MDLSFDAMLKEYDLTEVTGEQKKAAMRGVHSMGCASCGRIAYSEGQPRRLMIEGGNLAYYAGLEYADKPILIAGNVTLWETHEQPGECNVADLVESLSNPSTVQP